MLFSGNFSQGMWEKDEPKECRFVFIGRNLDKQALIDGVMKFKVGGELRFKVGDLVFERWGGGWSPGVIMMLWDDGNPYVIQLNDGDQVWGPMDDDSFVKSRTADQTEKLPLGEDD